MRVAVATAAGLGALALPGTLKLALRGCLRVSVDGITTIDDAVAACRRSGLAGWDLVAFAQRLVARQFGVYSTRNWWDTPARAFEHGMGYCTQYSLALEQVLDRPGFDTQAVHSLKVRVDRRPDWTMGHTWLRMRIADETRDVCAGHEENAPGRVGFTPILPVWPGNRLVFFLTHLGMIPFCGFVEWRALLSGKGDSVWTFVE